MKTSPIVPSARGRGPAASLVSSACGLLAAVVLAGAANAAIFTCTDSKGRRHTADRPIAACMDREQRVLNPDGSLNRIVPPAQSDQQRSDAERRKQEKQRELTLRKEAAQRDRNMLRRYPDERAHQAARESALQTISRAAASTKRRIEELRAARKPLQDEAGFYEGRPLPPNLRRQIDANDAAMQAQLSLVQTQESEARRINALFDTELARLKLLWSGLPPGSPDPAATPASEPQRR